MDVDADVKRSDDERGPTKPRGERDRRDSVRERERDRERRDRSPRRRGDHWEGDDRRTDRRSPRRRDRSRSRSRSRSRRHSPSPSRRRRGGGAGRSRSRSPTRGGGGGTSSRRDEPFSRSLGGPMNADHAEAVEFAKQSKRENRVYVGNLSYDVRYRDLIEFMRGAGEVLFAEVLITPTGQSKGCGLVEFATQEEAKTAIANLSESQLLGRPIFIREDREEESRFGQTPVPGKIGAAMAANGTSVPPPRPTYHGGPYRPTSTGFPPSMGTNPGNQLYVGNLPYQAGWQDIKDLFRHAGSVVRADINVGIDGRAKGSGTVVFETAKDAQNAINMYNSFEWYGRVLEVREDRFAGLHGPSRGRGLPRGSFSGRGGFGGGGGGGGGGSFRGRGGGRSTGNLYGDYTGPDGTSSGNGYAGGAPNGEVVPVQQILVTNLPWSTANEDLVELFETTGHVQQAEILYEGNRSKGMGIVQFEQIDEAETAIAKFTSYMYGGRPLGVQFNPTWHNFSPSAAKGGAA